MWRVILILAAILVIGDATGLMPEADVVSCTDDHDGKQCPPTCPTCACGWHSIKTAPAPLVELTAVNFVASTVELPPTYDVAGLLAPAPAQRPPIA